MLYFKKVRWQNFLSTGNQFTEIQLNKAKSTLIVGENGAGKSTMLDAISFALYGKPYRNINKNQLINSITGKGTIVEIEFSIKGKEYLVRRGIKPAKFEIYCDDVLVDQNASVREYQEHLEKHILKLNHKSFTQIVVIGSANFVPFMQMKVWERRDIIEDLLDIQIFTKMHAVLKERISENKTAITETKYGLDLLDQKIEMTKKHMSELMAMKYADRGAKESKISDIKNDIVATRISIDANIIEIEKLTEAMPDKNAAKNKREQLRKLNIQLKDKIDNIKQMIEFFESNDECPTCKQDIDSNFKQTHVCEQTDKHSELEVAITELQKHEAELDSVYSVIDRIQSKIAEFNQEIMEENTNIRMYEGQIKALEKELAEIPKEDDASLDELKEMKELRTKTASKHEVLIGKRAQYDIATSLLKEGGIKAKIIKQYVPVINKLMNKYLAAMEFFVQFELDEQFNEKIKSRFRDEFSYDSFSEGEKMRIDLSLLFTWRAVAKLRNSTTTNLLIMDEVFDSSLDNTGTDEFMKLITQLATDTNVFVISHKGDQLFDKFHSNIRFEKVKNFSQIAA